MVYSATASPTPAKMVTQPSLQLPFVHLSDTKFELGSRYHADVQMQCDKQVALQHPKHDLVIRVYEVLGLHDRREEVVVCLFGIGVRDRSHEGRKWWNGRLWEITFEFSGEGGKSVF